MKKNTQARIINAHKHTKTHKKTLKPHTLKTEQTQKTQKQYTKTDENKPKNTKKHANKHKKTQIPMWHQADLDRPPTKKNIPQLNSTNQSCFASKATRS